MTSPATIRYNCIAWAAHDIEHWWEPGEFWPIQVSPQACGIGDLIRAFQPLGFEPCVSDELEPGLEKIALYGNSLYYTHAARQLPTGSWTSKLGKREDIEHDNPDVVAGGLYGEVVEILARPHSVSSTNASRVTYESPPTDSNT